MDYFKIGPLKSLLGTAQPSDQPSASDTVEKLANRVQTSTLLEDRRDACRALKAMSRKYRVEVGAYSLEAIKQVVRIDRADTEIISYCLDILCNLTSNEVFEEEIDHNPKLADMNVGEQFTEMLVKNTEAVAACVACLEEYDFRVRRPAIKLMTNLLVHKAREMQDFVLVSPMGISKLMDLLSDNREVIRNDALLLITQLTKGNANIQKIVAFENAFDRLFNVIAEEGGVDGGIVVEDCLLLLLNLLKNNVSNQNFFFEGSYIQKLAPMLQVPEDDAWTPQKVSNFHCCLLVVRTLVSPRNPQLVVVNSQKAIRNCNVLQTLCNLLMASGVPVDVLTETINTIADVIRGNIHNQEFFANIMAPSTPPRPALTILLMSLVNEKQPFHLRCSVLYCFQCFLYRNEFGQAQVIVTLFPQEDKSQLLTVGQLLCGGLFSGDPLTCWLASVALSYTLVDNLAQKEQLLNVFLSTNASVSPVTFMQQCTTLLQKETRLQAKLGVLILISTWLANCHYAVRQFLNISGNMAFLTAQTSASEHDENEELIQGVCAFIMGLCLMFNDDSVHSFTVDNLYQLIDKRTGIETFLAKLSEVSKSEVYNKASKQPQIKCAQPAQLFLDYEFCKLFKQFEGPLTQVITQRFNLNASHATEISLSSHENGLLLQYKELIREQDRKLHDLQSIHERVCREKMDVQAKLDEANALNNQLQDQNTLLRAQISTGVAQPMPVEHLNCATNENDASTHEINVLRKENEWLKGEVQQWKNDQHDLLELLTEQGAKYRRCKERLRELGDAIGDENSDDNSAASSDNESRQC